MKELEKILTTFNEIQKKLEEYLENKWKLFPWFYFISDDELLLILSSSTELLTIEKHL